MSEEGWRDEVLRMRKVLDEDSIKLETGFEIVRELRCCRVPYCPRPVARGLWHHYSTSGFALGESFALLLQHGFYPDWAYLIVEMCAEGWSQKRIGAYILTEMEGVYPPDVAEKIRAGIGRMTEEKTCQNT